MRLAEYGECVVENRITCKVLVGKPDKKRQLGRPRRR
jgi:hypothetical protein